MAIDSPFTTYEGTTTHMRAITDVISLIDPADAVVVEALGGLDGAASKFRFVNWPSTKVEWLEDTLPPLADALNGSITSTATTITVDDASLFEPGMVLLIDSEYVWVSAANTGTEVLTVTRGYGGTQATHADNATVEIVSMARLEGADSDPLAFTDRTAPYNYTSTFHQEVKVSRSKIQISQYGLEDEFQYEVNKAIPHLMRLLNLTAYHGQRKAGSTTTPRSMGGLGTFITDNTINAGGAVTQADFEDALEEAYKDGGTGPWVAFLSPANMQVVKNFYDNSNVLRIARDEDTVGVVIERIVTPFGMVDLAMDRNAPNDKIYIVDAKHAGFLTYFPFSWHELGIDGDYQKAEVVGEFTLCVRQDKAHALITGIS